MDIKKIKKLIEMVSESNIAELEIKEQDESVKIVLNIAQPSHQQYLPPAMASVALLNAASPETTAACDAGKSPAKPSNVEYSVESPMVGTVYLSASPGEPAFVELGKKIKIGDTLCLIEAMKTFNKIEADRAGVINSILVDNGQPVEYGQPLFIIE